MYCRTLLAHIWTMRPLLYHTVQDGVCPHFGHAPLTTLHSAGRCWPTLGPCSPYCTIPGVTLHCRGCNTAQTRSSSHYTRLLARLHMDRHCQLPVPNGATLHFHCYSISSQTTSYLLVNAAKACPSPAQHGPRKNRAASCQRSFSVVQFHLCSRRHTFRDRQTDVRKVETSNQLSAGVLLPQSANADCYIRKVHTGI